MASSASPAGRDLAAQARAAADADRSDGDGGEQGAADDADGAPAQAVVVGDDGRLGDLHAGW